MAFGGQGLCPIVPLRNSRSIPGSSRGPSLGFRRRDPSGQEARLSECPGLPCKTVEGILPAHEVPSFWPDRNPDARLLVRWHALPAVVVGYSVGPGACRRTSQSRGDHRALHGTGHPSHRDGPRLRFLGNAAGARAGQVSARVDDPPDQGDAQADRAGVPGDLRDLHGLLEAGPCGPAVHPWHQQPSALGRDAPQGRSAGSSSARGACAMWASAPMRRRM